MNLLNPRPYLDPVVDRVRVARRAVAQACKFDVDKMADLFQQMQTEHPERVATPKREDPSKTPGMRR